ncbi:MAG: nucleotidyltransferase [Candidatus Paceibacterota bacterium]|jgi:hypothetical protein
MFNEVVMYLLQILQKYQAQDLTGYAGQIIQLKNILYDWANGCLLEIKDSGSRAKGTAISLASDVDYLISLSNGCNQSNGGLEFTFNQLFQHLKDQGYQNVRKQNVSTRITLGSLEIDITPATKQLGNTSDHSIWRSKNGTWQKTNIQRHITDVSQSGRINEIKLIKIWRELNNLDFPSIYLEYLIINNVLLNKSTDVANLGNNVWYILTELAKDYGNPLFARVVDPANSNNILSELLSQTEKNKIISMAKISSSQSNWNQILW